MNAQAETIVTLMLLAIPALFLWRTRGKRWAPHSEGAIDARSTRVFTADDRLEAYSLKFNKRDETHLSRQANGIAVQLRVAKHIRERPTVPRHRALVVMPQAKSNVVVLPTTGTEVPVLWRKPKLRMISR